MLELWSSHFDWPTLVSSKYHLRPTGFVFSEGSAMLAVALFTMNKQRRHWHGPRFGHSWHDALRSWSSDQFFEAKFRWCRWENRVKEIFIGVRVCYVFVRSWPSQAMRPRAFLRGNCVVVCPGMYCTLAEGPPMIRLYPLEGYTLARPRSYTSGRNVW